MPASTVSGVHCELWVRSLSPRGVRDRQATLVRRLAALAGAGTIDDYGVLVVGRELPARPADAVTDFGRYLLDRIADFQSWAAVNDRSLGSLFEPETVRSTIAGGTDRRIVLPVFTLAEYDDGALRFVAPCQGEAAVWTVQDRLAHLAVVGAGNDTVEPLSAARATPPEHSPVGQS